MAEKSEVATALKRLRERTGRSVRETAAAIGWKPTTYQRYEDAFKKEHQPVRLMRLLAPVFAPKVAAAELLALAGVAESSPEPAPKSPAADSPNGLFVYGTVKGGRNGEIVDTAKVVATVARPDYLAGVPDAFAMYVIGSSMEPRFRRGDLLFIHPGRPPNRGDEVVIAFPDNTGLVKIYLGASDQAFEFEQLNPKRKLRFPRHEIIGIYFVQGIKRP